MKNRENRKHKAPGLGIRNIHAKTHDHRSRRFGVIVDRQTDEMLNTRPKRETPLHRVYTVCTMVHISRICHRAESITFLKLIINPY